MGLFPWDLIFDPIIIIKHLILILHTVRCMESVFQFIHDLIRNVNNILFVDFFDNNNKIPNPT